MLALALLRHRHRPPRTRDLALCLAVIFLAASTAAKQLPKRSSAVIERYTERLMALHCVVAVGQGFCE